MPGIPGIAFAADVFFAWWWCGLGCLVSAAPAVPLSMNAPTQPAASAPPIRLTRICRPFRSWGDPCRRTRSRNRFRRVIARALPTGRAAQDQAHRLRAGRRAVLQLPAHCGGDGARAGLADAA